MGFYPDLNFVHVDVGRVATGSSVETVVPLGIFAPQHSRITRSAEPLIEKRRSKIQGWGVFATQPITKNTRIVTYDGEKITNRESLKREMRYLKQGHIWCFKLNRLYVRDAAVGGNIARYINHACEPNCYTRVIGDTIWIIAAREHPEG